MELIISLVAIAGALVVMTSLARRSGVQRTDLLRDMPGDELIGEAGYIADRSTILHASVEQVWPLLAVLGRQRAAWYAPFGIGRLFSPQKNLHRKDGHKQKNKSLQVGDVVPDWGPGSLQVALIEPPYSLVYTAYMKRKKGEEYAFSWAHSLEAVSETHCRLYTRLRVRRSRHRSQRLLTALLPFGGFFDYVTMTIMYAGLKSHIKK